jgi:hypothetical protein
MYVLSNAPQVGLPYIEESLRLVMAHMSSADASMGKAALDKCVENVSMFFILVKKTFSLTRGKVMFFTGGRT